MNKTAHLTTKFNELFGEKPTTNYFSPGRINLIGEHTDYNGGHVFPASITYGTYGVVAAEKTTRYWSTQQISKKSVSLNLGLMT